eukprot:CAMPEP_0198564518 /NCGR_PEP_ID=MMETSP1462-20131121/100415_1 /TAXON_ID=1333877 /ORGANISM="Brandtodinium nutriculum, Strain RCC3387" /LENGTH=41 /DNA_ID= /DNA_START= /DNA_END= /DNA_ORIENTATION=
MSAGRAMRTRARTVASETRQHVGSKDSTWSDDNVPACLCSP